MIPLIQAPAVILGMGGAVLVASPSASRRAIGFAAWLISDLLWIVVGGASGDLFIIGQFSFYLVTAAKGLQVSAKGRSP